MRLSKFIKLSLGLAFLPLVSFQAQALARAGEEPDVLGCTVSQELKLESWKYISPPMGSSSYPTGTILATTTGSITFKMDDRSSGLIEVDVGSTPSAGGEYSVAKTYTDSVGVRVDWARASGAPGLNYWHNAQNRLITDGRAPFPAAKANMNQSSGFNITFNFIYTVITYDFKYTRGPIDFRSGARVLANVYQVWFPPGSVYGVRKLCREVNLINDAAAYTPVIPPRPQPTCASFNIPQHVRMNPIPSANVTAYGSSRNSGTRSQATFNLDATRCTKGTKISAYFTDARAASSDKDYLTSSNPSVGVRLYGGAAQRPTQYGPAPTGSSFPARVGLTVGPASDNNERLLIPMVAQYVRIPGVDMQPGAVNAEATATIVYD